MPHWPSEIVGSAQQTISLYRDPQKVHLHRPPYVLSTEATTESSVSMEKYEVKNKERRRHEATISFTALLCVPGARSHLALKFRNTTVRRGVDNLAAWSVVRFVAFVNFLFKSCAGSQLCLCILILVLRIAQ